ncbi:hypothetical protein FH972_026523 [Carpinus fangiana]|uniref:Protein artemis n=1 Tax=Carpinus fangiana TaxID=176857 RepID=A0A5N6L6S1_9ROSI|nr:hypothetical protein FH972_026523 [Carpinus fangiana]
MSTFSGHVAEFPDIRIDNFRPHPHQPPPLACFLSHVHSDHLTGLESLKSPFVYCSAATRAILLRLERRTHRINFAQGILEARRQTYARLRRILKPLPLDTPVDLELAPGRHVRVTLFDANHCVGAVGFLIEGGGKSVLYTGDVRAEQHWVDGLAHHKVLVPYTHGLKVLDNLYLDTTFAAASAPLRRFASKAEGVAELLRKVASYSRETVFYFRAWTFGYEDVWLALSLALGCPVHLDAYRYRLYTSVANTRHMGPGLEAKEASVLCGHQVSNDFRAGILTRDESVRLHSCEKRSGCWVLAALATGDPRVVDITPIVSRHEGTDIHEFGAGGGKGDLDQNHELDLADPTAVSRLDELLKQSVDDADVLDGIREMLREGRESERMNLMLDEAETEEALDADIKLEEAVKILRRLAAGGRLGQDGKGHISGKRKSITFPYSRHSSFEELRALVQAFKPRDVYPCTVPPLDEWDKDMSMQALFGDLCTPGEDRFAWDEVMRERKARHVELQADAGEDELGFESQRSNDHEAVEVADEDEHLWGAMTLHGIQVGQKGLPTLDEEHGQVDSETESEADAGEAHSAITAQMPGLSEDAARRLNNRKRAYEAAASGAWDTIPLKCVKRKLIEGEEEL